MRDPITKLTEELDAIRNLKASGIMPPGISADDFARLLVELMSPLARRRFHKAFAEWLSKAELADRQERPKKK
jgi:hypothetical protein